MFTRAKVVRGFYNFAFLFFTASLVVFFLLEPAGFFHTNRSNHSSYGTPYRTEYYENSAGHEINLVITENPETPKTDHILLYMHGTTERLPYFMTDGSLFMPVASATVPGHHGTDGYPSISNAKESLNLALKKLNELGYSNDKIIVMGHSLGSASALDVAKRHPDVNRTIIVNGFNSSIGMCWEQAYILCGLTAFKQNNFIEGWLIDEGTVQIFTNPEDAFITFDKGALLFLSLNTEDRQFSTTYGDHGGPTIKQIMRQSLDMKPAIICEGCDDINELSFENETVKPTATIERGPTKIERLGRITSLWVLGGSLVIFGLVYLLYYLFSKQFSGWISRSKSRYTSKFRSDLSFWVFLNIAIIITSLQINWWYWRVTDMDDIVNFILLYVPGAILFLALAWYFNSSRKTQSTA